MASVGGSRRERKVSLSGLVLGFMGFGSTLEFAFRESGNDAMCGSLWERRVKWFAVVFPSGPPDGEIGTGERVCFPGGEGRER